MEHLSISRQSEYFTTKELQLMTGRPQDQFADVIVKELLDNAIDAAETKGVKPVAALEINESDGRMQIIVADNGKGMPSELIRKITDFNTRTSDKVARRLPSRGAQGNALKTILGIPTALGGGTVSIEANHIKHVIQPKTLPGGVVEIEHDELSSDWSIGTRITVDMPKLELNKDWQQAFEVFNPHLSFVKNEDFQKPELAGSI